MRLSRLDQIEPPRPRILLLMAAIEISRSTVIDAYCVAVVENALRRSGVPSALASTRTPAIYLSARSVPCPL